MLKTHNPKTVLTLSGILIFLLGVSFGILLQPAPISPSFPTSEPTMSGTSAPTADVPYPATLTGTYQCLPHKDTNGPQTLECALGLKTADTSYYALDMSRITFDEQTVKMNTTIIKVTGLLVPVEQLSSDHWQKYPIKGILQAESLEVVTN